MFGTLLHRDSFSGSDAVSGLNSLISIDTITGVIHSQIRDTVNGCDSFL